MSVGVAWFPDYGHIVAGIFTVYGGMSFNYNYNFYFNHTNQILTYRLSLATACQNPFSN